MVIIKMFIQQHREHLGSGSAMLVSEQAPQMQLKLTIHMSHLLAIMNTGSSHLRRF